MKDVSISDDIIYIGADDKTIDLFESQYAVPNGISYNSYLIKDEKVVVMDTIDKRKTDEWLENLEKNLDGRSPAYLVISHLEPDHAYNIELLAKKYPEMKLIGNDKTFAFIPQFFKIPDLENRKISVKEGEELNIGKHTLQFFIAPMVHWPEVMVTYEKTEKILFTADGFGKFGALDTEEEWACEARRYYFNIAGKYGTQVQSLIKKAATLDIKMICPLHGPILKENLEYYINLYDKWSKYEYEQDGVLIVYGSIHGNTAEAAKLFYEELKAQGKTAKLVDIARYDMAEAIEDAFKYSKMAVFCVTYNMSIFPNMNLFLTLLKEKNYQNRKVAVIENGTWAPNAGNVIKGYLSEMKNIEVIEPVLTIRSRMNEEIEGKLKKMAGVM